MGEDCTRAGSHFRLYPFTTGVSAEKMFLSGSLGRSADSLHLEYRLQGELEQILWPEIVPLAARCHELWRHTCFELFITVKGKTGYWEVNFSPSGCWNVYRFDGYRTGMREESAVGPPQSGVAVNSDFLSLRCSLNIKGIIDDSSELLCGCSSIIETTTGSISYWALAHYGTAPDFHDLRSFQLAVKGAGEPANPARRSK